MPPRNISKRYPFLSARSDVDWWDVKPALLEKLNALGRAKRTVITITSGRRGNDEQARLYKRYEDSGFNPAYIAAKPGRSAHQLGLVVDATAHGRPIWDAFGEKALKKFGFAHVGTPSHDRPHIGLAEDVSNRTPFVPGSSPVPDAAPVRSTSAATGGAPQPLAAPLDIYSPPLPGEAMVDGPEVLLPGSVDYQIDPRELAQTWKLLASRPTASDEDRNWARTSELALGG